MKRSSACLAIVLSLWPAACTSNPHPEGKPLPSLTFQNLQRIPLDVRSVDIVEEKKTPDAAFVMSPELVARNYFDSRFTAQGGRDKLRIIINEADVTTAEKPADGKVSRYFGIAGHDVYDVKIRITLQHVTDAGQVLYSRGLTARRTMNITEHASVAAREQHQFNGMEQLFTQLDGAINNIVLHEMKLNYSG